MSATMKSTKGRIGVGDTVPNFTLPTHSDEDFTLSSLLGKSNIVLFFYPKDESPGCTAEVCAFRDSFEVFKDAGATVIGVSSDSVESHKKFVEKHRLPFMLLSDKGGAVRKLYGVPASMGIFDGRVTYVIDKQGVVRHMFSSQLNINAHINEALETLKNLP